MILAMLKVMALSLIRDRGALAMAFLLPPTIFVIFAAIFSGTSGDELRLQLAYGSEVTSETATRFETAIRDEPSLRVLPDLFASEAAVRDTVASGQADVGLVLRGDLTAAEGEAPVLVIVDPGKLMGGAIVSGQVQRILAGNLADVGVARMAPSIEALVGGFNPQQSAQLAAAINQMASDPPSEESGGLVASETLQGRSGSGATVTYYAGAVAILFLLFSAMQGAATLIEERNSGIVDRLAVGPAGTDVVVVGKFLFLTLQGTIQVGLIFLVADHGAVGGGRGRAGAGAGVRLHHQAAGADGLDLRRPGVLGHWRVDGAPLHDAALVAGYRLVYAERVGHRGLSRSAVARRKPGRTDCVVPAACGAGACGRYDGAYRLALAAAAIGVGKWHSRTPRRPST